MKFSMTPAVVKASLVHLFTASGALIALLALQAIYQGNSRAALLWLLVALVMDGIDGPLARRFKVKEHLPQIDGVTLDLIVDFLSYVLVPAMFMWRFAFLPAPFEGLLLGAILLSSLYLFVHSGMKSDDNYFNGFPAAWNLVLFFWVILETSHTFNVLSTIVLCILTFVPIKTIHPVRVRRFNALNVVLVLVWTALSAVFFALSAEAHFAFKSIWAAITVYFVGFSFWRTLIG